MTHHNWLNSLDLREMIKDASRAGCGERRLRMFAIACVRSVLRQLPNDICIMALKFVEDLAERTPTPEDRRVERDLQTLLRHRSFVEHHDSDLTTRSAESAAWALLDTMCATGGSAADRAYCLSVGAYHSSTHVGGTETDVNRWYADLLRHIVPHKSTKLLDAPVYLPTLVKQMAWRAYESRDPFDFGLLADTVGEAGWPYAEKHLRDAEACPRGCFILDHLIDVNAADTRAWRAELGREARADAFAYVQDNQARLAELTTQQNRLARDRETERLAEREERRRRRWLR